MGRRWIASWAGAVGAVVAILIAWLKKNRDRTTGTVSLSVNDQLTAFRESMEQGDMTDEEFKKVKLCWLKSCANRAVP